MRLVKNIGRSLALSSLFVAGMMLLHQEAIAQEAPFDRPVPAFETIRASYQTARPVELPDLSTAAIVKLPIPIEAWDTCNCSKPQVITRMSTTGEEEIIPFEYIYYRGIEILTSSGKVTSTTTETTELTDNDPTSIVQYGADGDRETTAMIRLLFDQPQEIASLNFQLGRNSFSPTRYRVDYYLSEFDDVTTGTLVHWKDLPQRQATGATELTLSIPPVFATELVVSFESDQMIMLSEVNITDSAGNDLVSQGHGTPQTARQNAAIGYLLFLAEPGETYTVYQDPDPGADGTSFEINESINYVELADEASLITLGPPETNPFFSPDDRDMDGVSNREDNCPDHANPDQADADGNGVGDVCEDTDQDNILNADDNCPTYPNWKQEDTDGDGLGDACDQEESRVTERYPFLGWVAIGIASIMVGAAFFLTIRKTSSTTSDQMKV